MDPLRKIIHIDMDAFYAAVEQRNNPALKGKPVIVGGPPNSRSVVSTCSYEARAYGIHSAMSSAEAYKRCPNAVFVSDINFDEYRKVSKQINSIFHEVTSQVESYSLDEAYLDVTTNRLGQPSATRVAEWIRERIRNITSLTASAGVSYNKSLAKIASDWKKPNGLTVITPQYALEFLETLPVKKFLGVGPVTAKRMKRLGIHTGGDLKKWPLWRLIEEFGKSGPWFHGLCRGIDTREVVSNRARKSLGKERTFGRDKIDLEEMKTFLTDLSSSVWLELENEGLCGKTVTVKVKYADFQTATRSRTRESGFDSLDTLQRTISDLLMETEAGLRPVRLLGVSVSAFDTEQNTGDEYQPELEFPEWEE